MSGVTGWPEYPAIKIAIEEYLVNTVQKIRGSYWLEAGIDYVSVRVGDSEALVIGLPPVSDFQVELGEDADRLLMPAV